MAVAPTGAIYKALEFDGVSSRTYGVYITGEAVYNAPERDVEMITIPGRSGSFALDNGRFENITVTYPAGIFAETEADFREAISEFRNFLCSRKGYVRLQDEYNPDEYRMAVYKSGLEVEPAMLKAGEFEITFDCKPQRWLTSGEEAVTMPGKNKIPYPYYHSSGRVNRGITFTVSNDGAVHMSGTGEASTLQPFFSLTNNLEYLNSDTEYIMSQDTTTDKSFIAIYFKNEQGQDVSVPFSVTYDDGTVYNATRNYIRLLYSSITHKWCKFKFTSDTPVYIQTDVRTIENAGAVEGVVKPMIRLASDTDPNYVRYNGIYNPTLFEASPLLEVEGYGDITLNNDVITIENAPLGDVTVYGGYTSTSTIVAHVYFNIDVSRLNIGDSITLSGVQVNTNKEISSSATATAYMSVDVQSSSGIASSSTGITGTRTAYINYIPDAVVFNYGTSLTSSTSSLVTRERLKDSGGTSYHDVTHSFYAVYDGDSRIDIYVSSNNEHTTRNVSRYCVVPALTGFSTLSVLPTPIYIDLDIGEAYGEYSGVIASVNNIVQLPAELPTLSPGANTITHDNTITDLKITPRWWKV